MAELDDLAFEETYRRVYPMILSKCRRMLADGAEAQDLAQEVFVRLWRARAEVIEPAAVSGWLYRTCTRLAIDRARGRSRQERTFASFTVHSAAEGADPEALSASRRMLGQVVATTPERELEVVVLSRVDGLTHPEIAEVLAIGERTVRRLLTRFEQRLADLQVDGRSPA
jgi:RNA polymerase sigma-70 factor (ECF subfamily)